MKMKALQTRMTLIMEETSRLIKRDARVTGGGSDGDGHGFELLDATISERLNRSSEYARLAKDNLAMKEVSHMYMLYVFLLISVVCVANRPRMKGSSKRENKQLARRNTMLTRFMQAKSYYRLQLAAQGRQWQQMDRATPPKIQTIQTHQWTSFLWISPLKSRHMLTNVPPAALILMASPSLVRRRNSGQKDGVRLHQGVPWEGNWPLSWTS